MDCLQFTAVAAADGHRNGRIRRCSHLSYEVRFSLVLFESPVARHLQIVHHRRRSGSDVSADEYVDFSFEFVNHLVELNRDRLKLERKSNNSAAVIFTSFGTCSWWSAFFSAVGRHLYNSPGGSKPIHHPTTPLLKLDHRLRTRAALRHRRSLFVQSRIAKLFEESFLLSIREKKI